MRDDFLDPYPSFLPKLSDHVKRFLRENCRAEIARAEAEYARKLRRHWFRAVARTRRLRRFGGS